MAALDAPPLTLNFPMPHFPVNVILALPMSSFPQDDPINSLSSVRCHTPALDLSALPRQGKFVVFPSSHSRVKSDRARSPLSPLTSAHLPSCASTQINSISFSFSPFSVWRDGEAAYLNDLSGPYQFSSRHRLHYCGPSLISPDHSSSSPAVRRPLFSIRATFSHQFPPPPKFTDVDRLRFSSPKSLQGDVPVTA